MNKKSSDRNHKNVENLTKESINKTEEKIREILESLQCILSAHDSCAELIEFKDNKAVIYCGGPCVHCDNRCIEEAIKEKIPDIEVIII